MRPEYGCRIWDYLMEPFTDTVLNLVTTEVKRICQSDPRVQLLDLTVDSFENGLLVEVLLNYVPLNTTDQFILNFETKENQSGF